MRCSNPRCEKKRVDVEQNGMYSFGFENIRLCDSCYREWQRVKLSYFRQWLGAEPKKRVETRGMNAAKKLGIKG